MEIIISTTESCLPFTLDLIVELQHYFLQQEQLFALHLEIEGYTTFLLYLLLEFLSTGDLRQTFRWFLKRAEPEDPCKLILVAK